jgi:dihydroflavonol-4-reductase
MRHVVVTGAGGFIGSAVVRKLLAARRRVLAVLEPGGDARNLDGIDCERVELDVCDARALRRALSGAEALYHLAAVYKVWAPDPDPIYRVNVDAATGVLLAAQSERVPRVVFTSSIAAIGLRESETQGGAVIPSDETVRFNLYDLANDYILSKHLSERVAMRFAEAGLPVVVVNPSFPFGEGDRGPTPTGKILIDVARGAVPGWSRGGVNVVDVEVVAEGHLLAEEKGKVGERYILGDHDVTWRELFETIASVAGVPPPRREIPVTVARALAWVMEKQADLFTHTPPTATLRAVQYATRYAYFDPGKARRELGLRSVPLRETIGRAVAWFRDVGMLPR